MSPTGYWGPMIDGKRSWIRYTPDEQRIAEEREALRRRGSRLFSDPTKRFG